MYKITCFAPIEPEQLAKQLKAVHFKPVKKGFEWSLNGTFFRIEPFQEQPRGSLKAYRVSFNGDIPGGMYLFDLSIGCLDPMIKGVEQTITHHAMKNADWMNEIRKRPSYQMIDARGVYMKESVGVIVVNDTITYQIHSRKNNTLKLLDCLRKIEVMSIDMLPNDIDLFSYLEEEIA